MHIAIDITPLESGHQVRGVGSYTKLLVEALQTYEKSHSYSFFTRGQKVSGNADLVHCTYFDPFFLTLPLIKQKPVVVTVHDLIPLAYPSRFPRGIRGNVTWLIQKWSLAGAKRVITDSIVSQQDIHRITGVALDRIDVVYLAPSADFRPIKDQTVLSRIKAKYGLPGTFILYVGDVNWNKNIIGMLKAFQDLKQVKLVLVGNAFTDEHLTEAQEINRMIRSLELTKNIVKPGFVPDEDLVALYNLATVYVQPSFAEGFGLPILEAMACGCPVVAAAGSSLSEISGPAISVNSNDPQDIAKGIRHVLLFSPAQRKSLISAELDWVRSFSWKKVAHETVRSYEKCIDYHSGI